MTDDEVLDDILTNIEKLMVQLDDKQCFIKYFGYEGKMWYEARSGAPMLSLLRTPDQLFPCVRMPQSGGAWPILYVSVARHEYKSEKRNEPPIHSIRDQYGDICGAEDITNYDNFYITIRFRKVPNQMVSTDPWEENKERYKDYLRTTLGLGSTNANDIASVMAGGN